MQIYAVREVIGRLRDLIATDRLLNDLWVAGECSNVSRPQSGHVYFTLKDQNAQLRSVFFANPRAKTSRLIENGAAVLAHGRVGLYEQRGELQIVVDYIQPEGAGSLQAEYERLRDQLEVEGLFEASRKRALPRLPERIGIVTSASGSVFHDICNVLGRRWPLGEIILAPTPVQGPEAVAGIVGGLQALNECGGIDVIVVARGGGSIEELWAFNDVAVARAIFASAAPVISAVGHETDFTIADYVADLRAPTPSAAAELISPDRSQLQLRLRQITDRLASTLQHSLAARQSTLERSRQMMQRCVPDIGHQRLLTDNLTRSAQSAVERRHNEAKHGVGGFVWRLKSLNPYATLERGYAIVQRKGLVVTSIDTVRPGDRIDVRLKDGSFGSTVEGARIAKRRPRRAVPDAQASLFTMPEDRA